MNLYTLLTHSAQAALDLQRPDGSMPPGHNGLYHDPETPVRNTAHWLLTFQKVYQITQVDAYRQAVQKALRYLCQADLRPSGGTYICRNKPGKDVCNGLIGQAWALEALVAGAADAPDDLKPLDVAEAVFHAHPYDEERHLWQRVEPDGEILPFDMTFNHQLWLAAVGALLAAQVGGSVQQRVVDFMDALHDHLRIYPSGLVYHALRPRGDSLQLLKWLIRQYQRAAENKERAIGYHAFNMYAFALLKQQYPAHPFWQSQKFQQTLTYMQSEAYAQAVVGNKYGYSYNPSGFEIAFALEIFGGAATRPEQARWVTIQLEGTLNSQTYLVTEGTQDPETQAARLYEATRLTDLTLQQED